MEVSIIPRKDYTVELSKTIIPANHEIAGVTVNSVKRSCSCGYYDEYVFSYGGALITTTEDDWLQVRFTKKIKA